MITAERAKLIRDNFFEFSFSEEEDKIEPNIQLLSTLSTEEQYLLVSEYNWDDGAEVLNYIANSDKCDAGTAVMIFWMAEPDFYMQYKRKQDADEWAQDVWQLLQNVIVRFKTIGYASARLAYAVSHKPLMDALPLSKGIWLLPNTITQGTNGYVPRIGN